MFNVIHVQHHSKSKHPSKKILQGRLPAIDQARVIPVTEQEIIFVNSPYSEQKIHDTEIQMPESSGLQLGQEEIRKGFIRKVLFIILYQLLFTDIFIIAALYSPSYRQFQQNNSYLDIICVVILAITFIGLHCFKRCSRSVPMNYILLLLFTISIVAIAAGITSAAVATLAFYAVKTNSDITMKSGLCCVSSWEIFGLILLIIFFPESLLFSIACIVVIYIFAVFLIYDIRKLQGNCAEKYTIDDYIVAALNIYLDVILIFSYIISFLSCEGC